MKAFMKIALLVATLAWLPLSEVAAQSRSGRPVYVFGYGQSFSDSTVYMTTIAVLPDSALSPKTKFLADRESYSAQLETYLRTQGTEHAACAVFYSDKKSRLEKKYTTLRRRVQRDKELKLVELPRDGFTFVFVGASDQ